MNQACVAVAVWTICGMASTAWAGVVESRWLTPQNGSWSLASRWSAQGVPGIGAGVNQRAVVDAAGSAYTVVADTAGISMAGLRLASDAATISVIRSGFEVRGDTLIDGGRFFVANANGEATLHDTVVERGILDSGAGVLRLNGATIIRDTLRLGGQILGDGFLRFEDGAKIEGSGGIGVHATILGDMTVTGTVSFNSEMPSVIGPAGLLRLRGVWLRGLAGAVKIRAEGNTSNSWRMNSPTGISGNVVVEDGSTLNIVQGIESAANWVVEHGAFLNLGQSTHSVDNRFLEGGSLTVHGRLTLNGLNEFLAPILGDGEIYIRKDTIFTADQDFHNLRELSGTISGTGNIRIFNGGVTSTQRITLLGPEGLAPVDQPSVHFAEGSSITASDINAIRRTVLNEGTIRLTQTLFTDTTLVNALGGVIEARSIGREFTAPNIDVRNYGVMRIVDTAPQGEGVIRTVDNFGLIELQRSGGVTLSDVDNHGTITAGPGAIVSMVNTNLFAGSIADFAGGAKIFRTDGTGASVTLAGSLRVAGDVGWTRGELRIIGGEFEVGGVVRLTDTTNSSPPSDPLTRLTRLSTILDLDLERVEMSNGAVISGAGTVRITDWLDWRGGVLDGPGLRVLGEDAEAIVGVTTQRAYLNTNFRNEGLLKVRTLRTESQGEWTLTNAAGAELRAIDGSLSIFGSRAASGRAFTLRNDGMMDLRDASSVTLGNALGDLVGLRVENAGTLRLGAGSHRADQIVNTGVLSVDAGGTLAVFTGFSSSQNSVVSGGGTLRLLTGGPLTHTIDASLQDFGGTLAVEGTTRFNRAVDTGASFLVSAPATVFEEGGVIRGGFVNEAALSVTNGRLELLGGGENSGQMTITSASSLTLGGEWLFDDSGRITSMGGVAFTDGAFTLSRFLSLVSQGETVITESASLALGDRQNLASVRNEGVFVIADELWQSMSSYSQASGATLVVGSAQDPELGAIGVAGDATLDGDLAIRFAPVRGEATVEVLVLTAGSVSGEFAGVVLLGLPSTASVKMIYSDTQVWAIVAVPSPSGLVAGAAFAGLMGLRRRRGSALGAA